MNLSAFEQKTKEAEKPLVVDFWAPWCGPCKTTKPILEKLAEEYADKVDVLFVNADESKDVLQHYRIMGIPTMMAFRDGEVAARKTGAQAESNYRAVFDALLSGDAVRVPIAPLDRFLRLGTGTAMAVVGVQSGNGWLIGFGIVIAFLGVYDRCPIWAAITGFFRKRRD